MNFFTTVSCVDYDAASLVSSLVLSFSLSSLFLLFIYSNTLAIYILPGRYPLTPQ